MKTEIKYGKQQSKLCNSKAVIDNFRNNKLQNYQTYLTNETFNLDKLNRLQIIKQWEKLQNNKVFIRGYMTITDKKLLNCYTFFTNYTVNPKNEARY